jgi:two-component system, NarL family, sensor kinase
MGYARYNHNSLLCFICFRYMESSKEIALFIALSALALLLFITVIAVIVLWSRRKLLEKENTLKDIENKNQLELIKAIIDTEETQKTKIATDLHDQIIPVLTLTALNLSTRIKEFEKGNKDFIGALNQVDNVTTLANTVREIAHGIIPKLFTSFGLAKSIEVVVKQMSHNQHTKAIFSDNCTFAGELPFTLNKQLTIYRISLELLNNLHKHSNFNYLTVTLENTSETLNLVFAHNGKGITNSEITQLTLTGSGIGLKSLQSRALSLNAEINYSKDKEVSFVSLTIPFKHENKN